MNAPAWPCLGGRAGIRNLAPFLAAELGQQFLLDRALQDGLLPLVWAADAQQEALRGYVVIVQRKPPPHPRT